MGKLISYIVAIILIILFLVYFFNSITIKNRNYTKHVAFNSYKQLNSYFNKIGYENFNNIPNVYVDHLPKDLKEAPLNLRKELFIKIMLPLIKIVNSEIENQRNDIKKALKDKNTKLINNYMKKYKAKNFKDLLLKVDKVPTDIILAQAIIESGWGTSRFSIEGNNLFGEWTFKQGAGLVPQKRPKGAKYEVKYFPTLLDSLKSYVMNLNSSQFYENFRIARANKKVDIESTLESYSTRKEKYIESLKRVIKANNLSRFNGF